MMNIPPVMRTIVFVAAIVPSSAWLKRDISPKLAGFIDILLMEIDPKCVKSDVFILLRNAIVSLLMPSRIPSMQGFVIGSPVLLLGLLMIILL
jgi:hypothetical protein